ncbi:HEPN domain-containing protein [Hymenobacter terricola]|uniref:HEPN domain-containing protein n=1 Tax=Hymenobacter terricola TaxID=2819236 RepID=UPI001B309A3C|nr:HEPN domain-containing protein [Hymenobacter terricola]
MTKHDHILYWKETAEEDWLASQDLFQTKHYLQSLFLAHLTIEKLSKGHWVKDNSSDYPPRIHNILRLWGDTQLAPTADYENTAADLNRFQLEGRYPDYQRAVAQQATESYTRTLLHDTAQLRTWLLSKLP